MATFQDLLDQGFIELNTYDYEYNYNEIYPTEHNFNMKLETVGMKWKRIGRNSGEDVDVVCNMPTEISNTNITCYGRPCLYYQEGSVLDGLKIYDDPLGVPCFNNLGGKLQLYGADSLGDAYLLTKTSIKFPTTDFIDSYSGSNETVHKVIRNMTSQGFGGAMMQSNAAWIPLYGKKGIFKTNLPIFKSLTDVENYVNTGNTDTSINPYIPPTPEFDGNGFEYYYNYKEYVANTSNHSKGDQIGETKIAQFKSANENEYVAFVKQPDGTLELQSTAEYVLTFNPETSSFTTETLFSDIKISAIDGLKEDKFGELDTNIPIVDNLDDAKDIIPTSSSYNGTDATMNETTISQSLAFVNAYYINGSDLTDFAGILYANDADAQSALIGGLWMYNENPIDCIVDLCFYPFDLSPFISANSNFAAKFGSFIYGGEVVGIPAKNYYIIKSCNNKFTIVDQLITPIYNDFRDYNSVSYTLFLPYYGLFELDNVVIGKNLKINAYVDIFTSTLKYYIYTNNSLYDSVECAIGKHIAMMGTNWISKSNSNITNRSGTYVSGINAGMSAGGNLATGNVGGAFSNIFGSLNGMLSNNMNYLSKPTTKVAGSNSAGVNIYDPMSCYLIIEQFKTIKPNNLNKEYGKPTYKIDTLSTCKGLSEVCGVKLKTHATLTEQNEIIRMLEAGIIF